MNFSIPYHRQFNYANELLEFSIVYKKDEKALESFLKKFATSHRITVDISQLTEREMLDFYLHGGIEFFKNLQKQSEEKLFIVIKIPAILTAEDRSLEMNICIQCLEAGIPFFTDDRCDTWSKIRWLINVGVSDIYITNDLGYEIPSVCEYLEEHKVRSRAVINRAQSGGNPPFKMDSFFIRPDDAEFLGQFIDIYEFATDEDNQNYNTLYKIWVKDKTWFGKLNEIIIDLDDDIDNRFILPNWIETKMKCGLKCAKGTDVCQRCSVISRLSNTLQEKGYMFEENLQNNENYDIIDLENENEESEDKE